jgi:hypothetical protein
MIGRHNLAIFGVGIFLSGCAGMPPAAPEPRVVTVDVPRIVQVKCKDQRPPADVLPDTDDKLATYADDDFEGLSKAFRAGRDIRDARLTVDEVQIKGCAAE